MSDSLFPAMGDYTKKIAELEKENDQLEKQVRELQQDNKSLYLSQEERGKRNGMERAAEIVNKEITETTHREIWNALKSAAEAIRKEIK